MPTGHRPKSATTRQNPSRGKKTPRSRPTLASRADLHDLYQRAVQCPESEIDFVDATFTQLRNRTAARLREDFCGTANTACEWIRRRATNIAIGFDLDDPTLDWGRRYNVARLKPAQRERIDLRHSDVLAAHPDLRGTLDIVLAMNFSFWIFKERATLLAYFKRVREDLAPDGVFFLDFYGGYEALRTMKEKRPVPRAVTGQAEHSVCGFNHPFTYIWDQHDYNPITGDLTCKIHFLFKDGSKIRDAFIYNWRLWGLRETRDLLEEAGFKKTTVYWEGDDGDGGGDGEFKPTEQGEACAGWIAYLSAEK